MQTPITEDLMNEHGLLNRILIIMDEYLTFDKVKQKNNMPKIKKCIEIIKEFIEDFHEQMEEKYVFPHFTGKWRKLIDLLIQQHKESRLLTSSILKNIDNNDLDLLIQNLQSFVKMYRLHSAREDTIVFRKLRKFVSPAEFANISKIMDEEEDEKFGKHAYDNILKTILSL
jgi:hemerythrin-like domain-containing protein